MDKQVEKTGIRQVSNKFNFLMVIISIAVFVLCLIINIKKFLRADNIEWTRTGTYVISVIITFIAFMTLIFFGLKMYIVKSTNKYLKNLPYGFDYTKELYTYKMVGKNKKNMKYSAKSFSKYSEWESHINEFYEKQKNYENFDKFLIRMKRNKENMVDLLKSIVIPMEIAMISAFYNDATDPNTFFISIVITTTVLMCYFVIDISNIKDEINFLEDYMDILFNKKKKQMLLHE